MSYQIEKTWITNSGLKAVCLWVESCGHRCGYVGLPKELNHPLYGKSYSEHCDCLLSLVEKRLHSPVGKMNPIVMFCSMGKNQENLSEFNTPDFIFDVHGSLTFSGGSGKYPIEEKDMWWFGFDCGHAGDKSKYSLYGEGEERTVDYVISECESLAEQFIKAADEMEKEK